MPVLVRVQVGGGGVGGCVMGSAGHCRGCIRGTGREGMDMRVRSL